jgi:rsbT co-antagonist protein RsbR
MPQTESTTLPQLLLKNQAQVLKDWIAEQVRTRGSAKGGVKDQDLQRQSAEFLKAFQEATQSGAADDIQSDTWTRVREILTDISMEQARQGATPIQIATFVFSLKQILFRLLQAELSKSPEVFAAEIWQTTQILDRLGLFTTQVAMKSREDVIARQQAEMLELSLIGTLDSERTQVVMENLLQEIVRTGAGIAIIDITGVPTVDTLVAQHLLKTVAAARLMGAECIISGIRPQIASTIVHLGVDLGDVVTKATLADAFSIALRRNGMAVAKLAPVRKQAGE